MRRLVKKWFAAALSATMIFTGVPSAALTTYGGENTDAAESSDEYAGMEYTEIMPTEIDPGDYMPVGGWAPLDVHELDKDAAVSGVNGDLTKHTNVVNAPLAADSVFVKGTGSVGYNALTKDGQKTFYNRMDEIATAFMQSNSDLPTTTFNTSSGAEDVYVVGTINFNDLSLTDNQAYQAFYAYDYDHPGYYWISNSVWKISGTCLYLCTEPEYASVSARAVINSQITNGVKEYAALAQKAEDTLCPPP